MKYVILPGQAPLIFPDFVSHAEVADGRIVVSAGFCYIETFRNEFDDVRAHCSAWGKSDSLNISSNPNDAKILESIFR